VKILVVRRDNIGDLVCTTPLLSALRARFPDAWIGALVNSYNAPVLERNPDLDAVHSYRKLKHLQPGESALAAMGRQAGALWRLRQMNLDAVVLPTAGRTTRGLTLARWLNPVRIVASDSGDARTSALDARIALSPLDGVHEVDRVFALAKSFGIEGVPPPLTLIPDPQEVHKARASIGAHAGERRGHTVAVHISARRPAQRWTAICFADLIRGLTSKHGANVMLLWSPGAPDHPQHPGDDQKAAEVLDALRTGGAAAAVVVPYPTSTLSGLIGALAACDELICSDGGAMHLGAALGKPIVALFGDSPIERWRPWGVEHRIVRPASRVVADAPVADVLAAYSEITSPVGAASPIRDGR